MDITPFFSVTLPSRSVSLRDRMRMLQEQYRVQFSDPVSSFICSSFLFAGTPDGEQELFGGTFPEDVSLHKARAALPAEYAFASLGGFLEALSNPGCTKRLGKVLVCPGALSNMDISDGEALPYAKLGYSMKEHKVDLVTGKEEFLPGVVFLLVRRWS